MAAAVGIRTYGLFGAWPPFHHSSRIVPITPPGGVSTSDGMARISVEQVLATIEADQGGSNGLRDTADRPPEQAAVVRAC